VALTKAIRLRQPKDREGFVVSFMVNSSLGME
jgi:hypothetical protein